MITHSHCPDPCDQRATPGAEMVGAADLADLTARPPQKRMRGDVQLQLMPRRKLSCHCPASLLCFLAVGGLLAALWLVERPDPLARVNVDSTTSLVGASHSSTSDASQHVSGSVVLVHDFGYVRAGEVFMHAFVLENPSAEPWLISGVLNSCKCTVAKIETPTIDPQSVARISVSYSAPGIRYDDERTVTVFATPLTGDGSGRTFHLVVRARARLPLSMSQSRVDFGSHPLGVNLTRVVLIENFSDTDWTDLDLISAPSWLTGQLWPIAPMGDGPRQAWKLVLRTDEPVAAKRHDGEVVIRSSCPGGGMDGVLPVAVDFIQPVSLSRTVLFFGEVSLGETACREIDIDATRLVDEVSLSDWQVEHGLGSDLDLRFERRDRNAFVLRAAFAPSNAGDIRGLVRLRFSGSDHWRSIPVVARVREGGHL